MVGVWRKWLVVLGLFINGLSHAAAMDAAPATGSGFYQTSDGRAGFVLDRIGSEARLRFDAQDEVFALRWKPAVNGDKVLVRDDGEVVLRMTPLGGITLFSPEFPNGVPVVYQRVAMPLEAPPPPIETVQEVAATAAARLRQVYGSAIRFEGPWAAAADDGGLRLVLFDAVRNAESAFLMLSSYGSEREAVRRLSPRVIFAVGPQPGVTRKGSELRVIFALDRGVSGRASSYRMLTDLRATLR
ncbi:MAG TPA: hypothetical protein DCL54_00765 [Alphaproteobacteria bacterium]|nr:hypothetical protein [Alphaproteobacteria bacterium]HAJ45097.1 hypothetical protein [Alphaproteobacteria bacterium]